MLRGRPLSSAVQMTTPLEGVTVLDASHFAAGPYCSMLLADAGARVIKIEPPGRGEPYRSEGPILTSDSGVRQGSYFLRFNRSKESVTLNLNAERGKELFRSLVKAADVLVENFRPDTLDRLGLGYSTLREINPRLVYASISGFGHTDIDPSPYWQWPALAVVAEAVSGVMDRIGDAGCPPHWSGVSAGDLYAGGLAVGGVVMALYQRAVNGQGQHVDISMVDCMLSLNERAIFTYETTGEVLDRGGPEQIAPFGPFRAKDGYVAIGVIGDPIWIRFCNAIGRPELLEDDRLRDGTGRSRHMQGFLGPIIEEWLSHKGKVEASHLLLDANVPAAPVNNAAEAAESEHVIARRMLFDVEYPGFGTFKVVGSPLKMSGNPTRTVVTAPNLGQHTDTVLREFAGLDGSELDELRAAGTI
ncbi:MAG: CaiB/BaiF CoA transferase family protein [Fimbriimonadales bacterium]